MGSAQNKEKVVSWKKAITKLPFFFQVGVQVFTKRPLDEQQNSFNPDSVITCLKKYPKALVKYLEHLVIDRRLQVSTSKLRLTCAGLPGHSSDLRDRVGLEGLLADGSNAIF